MVDTTMLNMRSGEKLENSLTGQIDGGSKTCKTGISFNALIISAVFIIWSVADFRRCAVPTIFF